METLYFSAVATIVAYLAATIVAYRGVPPSISQSYYIWRGRGMRFLFTFVMTATAFPLLIYWVSVAGSLSCLAFLSVSGMLFVGGACAFQETLTRGVHYSSAGVWATSAVLFFALRQMWLPMAVGVAFGFGMWLLLGRKNLTFWAEIACVTMQIVGIAML